MSDKLLIDGDTLTIDEAYAVAVGHLRVGLAPRARERMLRTRAVVDGIVEREATVYGVTTGFASRRFSGAITTEVLKSRSHTGGRSATGAQSSIRSG
jgi:histidine ammonia-lyase